MATAIRITRDDLDAAGLRRTARRASSVAASRRMLALVLVLEGASRAEAAQTAGVDRQTLRDWMHRTNEEGLAGLTDRPGEFGPSTLLHLPPCSLEPNPVETVWATLHSNTLSNRVFDTYDTIVDACSNAWNWLAAQPDRITSIGTRTWACVTQ